MIRDWMEYHWEHCFVCGVDASICECPECPSCKQSGNPECIGKKKHIPLSKIIFKHGVFGPQLGDLLGYESPRELARVYSKYGFVHIGFLIYGLGWIYGRELPNKWSPGDFYQEIDVSGSVGDAEITTTEKLTGTVKEIKKKIDNLVEEVANEVDFIYLSTYGCENCAVLFGIEYKEGGENPIHPECQWLHMP